MIFIVGMIGLKNLFVKVNNGALWPGEYIIYRVKIEGWRVFQVSDLKQL